MCTIVIQDKPKTGFGKWIHGGVLAIIYIEKKKLRTAALRKSCLTLKFIVINYITHNSTNKYL